MNQRMHILDACNIAGMMAHIDRKSALTPSEITGAKEIRAILELANDNHGRYCSQGPEVKQVNKALEQMRGLLN